MEVLIGLFLLFIALATLILPWVNRSRVLSLREEVQDLRWALLELERRVVKESAKTPLPEKAEEPPKKVIASVNVNPYLEDKEQKAEEKPQEVEEKIIQEEVSQGSGKEIVQKREFNFEQQFGARLPVWIGGIALALGGFFLVKYSIDNNLLSPGIRVSLGGLLGTVLLIAARWIREKQTISDGIRIAQSLSGAGIAILYISVFAAASLYQLIPVFMGLGGMAVITGVAVILSLRHGMPIALLGLVGGFLTPALLSYHSDIPTPVLFLYLYIIFSGLMAVIKQRKWWGLSIPALIGAFLWVGSWIFSSFTPDDTIWIGLFLMAVSATIVIASRKEYEESAPAPTDFMNRSYMLNYLGLGGAMILMGVITSEAGFGFLEWSLFGLLSAGGIGLAYFKDKLYGFVPWASMAVNAVMLFAWHGHSPDEFALTLGAFALLYTGSAYVLTWRSVVPVLWAGLASATALGYYLLAWYKLHTAMPFTDIPLYWGALAFALAAAAIHMAHKTLKRFAEDDPNKEILLAIFSVATTAFISLALTIELEREFLSVAFAAEVLAVSWISTRISIKALRYIAMVLALVFAFLLIPQALLLIQLTVYSLIEAKLHLQKAVPIVQWPLFQLGVPAAMFIGASYHLRKNIDGKLVRAFELAALGLVAVMGYYLNRHAFHVADDILFKDAGFFERNVMTNILFAYGLGCFFIGRRYGRIAFSWSGMALSAVALFRLVYFDMMMHNPLWTHQTIRGVYIFNELLLAFGLPIIWAKLVGRELVYFDQEKWARTTGGLILLFVFTLISMNVRHVFHGMDLSTGVTTNAEIYTYSAVWLLLGIALLVAGVLKKDKMIRYASLFIMILSVAKAFLYDASELEGLYRVFSFLGLGLCLLGLSYFYTRFVFKSEMHSDAK